MKIHINEDSNTQEMEVTINCRYITKDVEKIISMLRILDLKLVGLKDNESYILDASDIIYIDTVDKKTFLYTNKDVYETSFKLYELEEELADADFIRANKSAIINFRQIRAIRADIDGKLLITMENGERLFVSRQYAPVFKKKLGSKAQKSE